MAKDQRAIDREAEEKRQAAVRDAIEKRTRDEKGNPRPLP